MVQGLQISVRAPINGYTGMTSEQQYWSPARSGGQSPYPNERYSMYHTFYDQVNNHLQVQRPVLPDSFPLAQGTDHTLRGLRQSAYVDDGLDEISYPITAIDTCDCVTFPEDGFVLNPCSNSAYWGTFEVKFTDGSCYDVTFDESSVYANCPSETSTDAETEYVLCAVDFTEGTSDGVSDEVSTTDATGGITKANSKKAETTAKSLRQEATSGVVKTTHIHLTVHRLLTFALEAVLALQPVWS